MNQRTQSRPMAEPIPKKLSPAAGRTRSKNDFDVVWVRRALGICRYLEAVHALPPRNRSIVAFAVMWAPYGGSSSTELLVTFGMARSKFLSALVGTLAPNPSEKKQVQELKTSLRDDLIECWTHGSCDDHV